jgi:hypothetical protein
MTYNADYWKTRTKRLASEISLQSTLSPDKTRPSMQVFDSNTAKDIGYTLEPDWQVKREVTAIGDKDTLISPAKWEFTDLIRDDAGNIADYIAHDPEGNQYTKAELDLYEENTDEQGNILPEVEQTNWFMQNFPVTAKVVMGALGGLSAGADWLNTAINTQLNKTDAGLAFNEWQANPLIQKSEFFKNSFVNKWILAGSEHEALTIGDLINNVIQIAPIPGARKIPYSKEAIDKMGEQLMKQLAVASDESKRLLSEAKPVVGKLATEETGSVRLPGGGVPEKSPTPKVTPEVKEPWQMTRKSLISTKKQPLSPIGSEIQFIRYGSPTQNSIDYTTNQTLQGMSVYELDSRGASKTIIRGEFADRKDVYIGKGTIVGYGSDGEPLVKNYTLRKASPLQDERAYYDGLSREEWGKRLNTHKSTVQQALSEGKPVPPEVLKDYPDLVTPEVKPVRGTEPPKLEDLSAWVKEKKGQPGITKEGSWIPAFQDYSPNSTQYVYRNPNGDIEGILSIIGGKNEAGVVDYAVSIAAKPSRVSIGKQLIEQAIKDGYPPDLLLKQDFTKSGARFTNRLLNETPTPKAEVPTTSVKDTVESLLSEGKPVPKDMMDEYIKLAKETPELKTNVPKIKSPLATTSGSGTVPPARTTVKSTPVPPTPPKSPLGTIEGMWNQGRQPVPKSVDTYLKAQEYGNDIYYGIRRMQGQVSKNLSIETGGKNDVITLLTRSPGAANAGATRYILAIEEVKKIAPNAMADDINTILYANHAKEVLAEKGAKRVMAGGFTTQAELDAALSQLETKLGKAEFAKVTKAAEHIQGIYANELKRLVEEGLVSKELGDELAKKYPWYNPLQYVEDAEILANQGKSVKPFNVISSGIKRLTEVGTAKEASAPLNILGDQLIKNEVRIVKNQTGRAIIDLALQDKALGVHKISTIRPVASVGGESVFRPTYEDIPGTLSFFENGKRQVYQVPDFIYREANVLNKTISNPVSSLIGAMNGISRSAFTTASPPFVVSNILNDMLTAFLNRGILPHETGMRLISAMRGLENDKIMQAFRLSGGYQQRFYGRGANALAKDVGVTSGKVITDSKSFMKKVWEAVPAAGEAGEQAPRTALFKRQLDRTLPEWRNMTVEAIAATPQGRKAAADAVELTINFGRGGYLIKAANPFVIFLNASMEGTKLPFRVLRTNPAARWRLAGVAAGVTGLAAYNLSYPEYMDIPNNIRWGSVVIMLPSNKKNPDGTNVPNYVTIIPKTREWGMLLGSLGYAMESMYAKDPANFGTFSSTMAPMLSPISEVPIPQVIAELVEQQANWDFYTSRPIVSQSLQNLPTGEQTTPNVSRTIEAGAKALGISPVRTQHFISGLFGGASQTITSVTDWIAKLVAPETPSPEVAALADQYNALPESEQPNFLKKLNASNKRALENYLTGRREALPILGAIGRRIMPGYGGQLESNQYDLEEKVSVLPSYWTKTMTPEQMESVDVKLWTQKKKDDANIIQKYDIDTMGMDDYSKEEYLKTHSDLEATLLLWAHKTSIISLEAANKLDSMATEYGIPLESIPAFGKTDSGKERIPPQNLWATYFAYYALEKLDETTGKMVADTKKREAFRKSNPEFEAWGEANLGWKPLTSSSTSSSGTSSAVNIK